MRPGTGESGARSGVAFGMRVESSFPVVGLAAGVASADRTISLSQVPELSEPAAATRISESRHPDGRVAASIDALAEAGYLARADGYGAFLLAPDGRTVSCAPAEAPPWLWQRYLVGQVLPFAAVLQGLEVLHASAVVSGGGAVAFAGQPGGGKTSLALSLVDRGASFLTDDVLALEAGGDGVVAHPGAGVVSLRHAVPAQVGAFGHVGERVGDDGEALRLEVQRHREPAPLRSLTVIRSAEEGEAPAIERLDPVDPKLLLSSTFNFVLRDPERLATQLDVCARVARSAVVHRLTVPRGEGLLEATHLAASLIEAG